MRELNPFLVSGSSYPIGILVVEQSSNAFAGQTGVIGPKQTQSTVSLPGSTFSVCNGHGAVSEFADE